MIKMNGSPVFGGIARGFITYYHRDEIFVNKLKVSDPQHEYDRYLTAKDEAVAELDGLYQHALKEVGEKDAQIFMIHQMILDDSQYEQLVKDYILEKRCNADYAVARTAMSFSNILADMDSDYIKERQADVNDVSERVIRLIQQRADCGPIGDNKSIVFADDLLPSETVSLDRSKVAAFCTAGGSPNSHTAILARTMNIPAIVGMGRQLNDIYNGKYAIVDGYSGTLYIEPDEKTIRMLRHKEDEEGRKRELLVRLKGRRNITRDGREFSVYANISSLSDISSAVENDCGGIGLFRSEFLYMKRNVLPTEEELFYNYRRVIEDMHGKITVIRTLDAANESVEKCFQDEDNYNSNIGFRSFKMCLEKKEILKTQLRALYRASVYGNLSLLIPMVTDVEDVRRVKDLMNEVKEELIEEGIPFSRNIGFGIMIETPAAVMISDILAKEADFFSIGTNDLEQFTLAVDRQNPRYESLVPQNHTALLRMIKMVCDNAHSCGKRVCICGELGADLSLTELFLDMHVDALSVTPSQILPVRKTIRSLNLSDRRQIHNNIQRALKY